MKFDDLDAMMRAYEREYDQKIPKDSFLVARLDGRSFTRLTKEVCSGLERPFDVRFRDAMVETARHLMRCGFEVVYAYTESDEISLLFAYGASTFERKIRKYVSILAGEASAAFSQALGEMGVFDCRMVPLPNLNAVRDYFRWRQEDSHRNSLNAYVYWTMRDRGMGAREADKVLLNISNDRKKEILADAGIDYESAPAWQRWGTGLYMEKFERRGLNPKTGKEEVGYGNAVKVDYDLPVGEPYGEMVVSLVSPSYYRERLREERTEMEHTEMEHTEVSSVDSLREEPKVIGTVLGEMAGLRKDVVKRMAWNIVRTLNKTMSSQVDDTLSHRGLNFFDVMSVKHRTLSYAEFFIGFEEELDRLMDIQIGALPDVEKMLFRFRDPLLFHEEWDESVILAAKEEIKEEFGKILDGHYSTARMRRFLERYPWLEK